MYEKVYYKICNYLYVRKYVREGVLLGVQYIWNGYEVDMLK